MLCGASWLVGTCRAKQILSFVTLRALAKKIACVISGLVGRHSCLPLPWSRWFSVKLLWTCWLGLGFSLCAGALQHRAFVQESPAHESWGTGSSWAVLLVASVTSDRTGSHRRTQPAERLRVVWLACSGSQHHAQPTPVWTGCLDPSFFCNLIAFAGLEPPKSEHGELEVEFKASEIRSKQHLDLMPWGFSPVCICLRSNWKLDLPSAYNFFLIWRHESFH